MMEPSNLWLRAREILATPSHEGLEIVVQHLSMRHETFEFQTAAALYNLCVAYFANLLTLKLLKVYQSSSDDVFRSRSIRLLDGTLAKLRAHRVELSLVALYEIKPLVISCLEMQETEESNGRILPGIVSFVAYNVMMLDNGGWDELSDCILSLADKEPFKAFLVFIDLPPVYPSFIKRFMQRILEEAEKVLFNPGKFGLQDWTLGLVTVVKMGIQLLDTQCGFHLIKNLISVLEKSASELTKKGMEQFLQQGLERLEEFLALDSVYFGYNDDQCYFASAVVCSIEKVLSHTKKDQPMKLSTSSPMQVQEKLKNRGAECERDWYDYLKTLSAMEVLRIFASTDLEERSRELAIRCLEILLADHTSKKAEIEFPVMKQLMSLLLSCLWSNEISDSMFKVLGKVVNHVVHGMFYQKDSWFGLGDYIASKSKTEFERAVYIFQCLTMPLEDEFLVPVKEFLLPEIITRLNPPREVLVDNSGWVLSFTGAFCAAIHLTEITRQVIMDKMVGSVEELVEREMEIGLVRRAFRDMESIVRKQLGWYGKSEYKFLKALLQSLYAIKGMKWESKIVLWRINVIVTRKVAMVENE